jgi:hypothetical protein
MRRHLPVLVALLSPFLAAPDVSAQTAPDPPVATRAAAAVGRIDGLVTDTAGEALERVSILALGTALAAVRTDGHGRFSLSLPPGQYILRATRDGYISTYREAVRVHSDVALKRVITLVRAATEATTQPGAVAGAGDSPDAVSETPSDHGHSATAWRLRHLPRSVLRETAMTGGGIDGAEFPTESDSAPVAWLVLNSARAASTFFADTDFNGQVNFLATSAVSMSGLPETAEWARGVAYIVLGAPVGAHGDWSVRAAMAPGEHPSWAFQGEYQARREQSHAFRAGVSYSTQAEETQMAERLPVAAPASTRRVAGVYGFDRWTVTPGVVLDYGVKVDRYDYLASPALVSGRLGLTAEIAPGMAVTVGAAPRMVAPGAHQFMPPGAHGVWLPPQRTFDGLGGAPLEPEQVEYYELGIQAELPGSLITTIRGFTEQTDNQIATLFGFDTESAVGHYYVTSPGSVSVSGLAVEVSGEIFDSIRGRLTYTRTEADWTATRGASGLSPLEVSLLRRGIERGHDLTTALEATVPGTATQVSLAYRLSSVYSGWRSDSVAESRTGGRYKVEVRQALPYKPLRDGELNLLVAARTLLHDVGVGGAFYDELLTMAPPMQVTCGLQMRF